MKKKLLIVFCLMVTFSMLSGCPTIEVAKFRREAAKNSSKLFDLKIGMTKKEVIDIMDKPDKTEAYEIQGKNLEFWLYLTEYELRSYSTKTEYTPLAFEEGILKGWGRNYYDQALRIKQEIKIEQK